jgi:hypothetical protein
LKFPNEYYDTVSGQIESEKQKIELYKNYLARPPGKRVNYLKQAFLTPFYLPFKSLNLSIKLYLRLLFIFILSSQGILNINQKEINNTLENVEFFILRNNQLLKKLSDLFFNKSIRLKFNEKDLLNLLNLHENEFNTIIYKSYVGIRLKSIDKGTMDKFSLLFSKYTPTYPSETETKNNFKIIINQLITNHMNDYLEKFNNQTKDASKNISRNNKNNISNNPINNLIRSKFNKNDILTIESKYNQFELNMFDCKGHKFPVGFIFNNGFSLVDGKYTANGFILTKFIIESIVFSNNNNKAGYQNDSTIIDYKIPSANHLFKQAKITNFFS